MKTIPVVGSPSAYQEALDIVAGTPAGFFARILDSCSFCSCQCTVGVLCQIVCVQCVVSIVSICSIDIGTVHDSFHSSKSSFGTDVSVGRSLCCSHGSRQYIIVGDSLVSLECSECIGQCSACRCFHSLAVQCRGVGNSCSCVSFRHSIIIICQYSVSEDEPVRTVERRNFHRQVHDTVVTYVSINGIGIFTCVKQGVGICNRIRIGVTCSVFSPSFYADLLLIGSNESSGDIIACCIQCDAVSITCVTVECISCYLIYTLCQSFDCISENTCSLIYFTWRRAVSIAP